MAPSRPSYSSSTTTLTEDDRPAVKAKWIENHRDHSPAVLPKGWDLTQPGANPEQSQLLETRKWGALEVARGLGIFPPELLLAEVGGSSLTYQNIAEALMTFLRVTVQPLYLVAGRGIAIGPTARHAVGAILDRRD